MKKFSALVASMALLLPLAACNVQKMEKEDEGNEVKVPIEQVPPAVRATLQQQAPGVSIAQVDKEVEDGNTTYEADAMIGGQNYEIKVSEDGRLISKKPDNESEEKGKKKGGEEKEEK